MLAPADEHELRSRVGDLVLAWHAEREGGDAAEVASAEAYRNLVEAAAVVESEANLSLARWVEGARRAGLSWAELGEVLGTSRQAVQQRFGQGAADRPAHDDEALIVRKGVTAFNEVEVLRVEGLAGREVVGANWLTLSFRQTDRRWENRRVVSLRRSQPIEAMAAEGWEYVFSWYPYLYFKRPLRDDAPTPASGGR